MSNTARRRATRGRLFRWTKIRVAMRTLIEKGEKTAQEVFEIRRRLISNRGVRLGWRASEIAATVADEFEEVCEVAKRLGVEPPMPEKARERSSP